MPDEIVDEGKVFADLADAIEALPPVRSATAEGKHLRFLLYEKTGYCITTSRAIAQALCTIWNHRALIVKALRAYGASA